mgnify:CR=1 FL=1
MTMRASLVAGLRCLPVIAGTFVIMVGIRVAGLFNLLVVIKGGFRFILTRTWFAVSLRATMVGRALPGGREDDAIWHRPCMRVVGHGLYPLWEWDRRGRCMPGCGVRGMPRQHKPPRSCHATCWNNGAWGGWFCAGTGGRTNKYFMPYRFVKSIFYEYMPAVLRVFMPVAERPV